MKKISKWFSLVLASLLLLSLFTGFATAETTLKAAMITPQKLGDDGPIDACYAGLQAGAEEFGYEIKVLEPQSGEYEDSIRAMADDGYTLIFCIFAQMQDAVSRVAPEYPDVKFVQILGDLEMDNVKTLNFKDQEASFLSGIAAAKMTKTGKIAVIAGAPVAITSAILPVLKLVPGKPIRIFR